MESPADARSLRSAELPVARPRRSPAPAPAPALRPRAPGAPAPRRRSRRLGLCCPAGGVGTAGVEPGLRAGSEHGRLRSYAPPARRGRPQARGLRGLTPGSSPSGRGGHSAVSRAARLGGESPAPSSRLRRRVAGRQRVAATASVAARPRSAGP